MFTPENLLGQMIFGAIGAGVFMYGKNKPSLKLLLMGALLAVYPYFVEETWQIFAIGGGLTLALFFI